MAKIKCEKCHSENVRVNCCMYWTIPDETEPESLRYENSDDGIHVNGIVCDDCDHWDSWN
jgi:hypothetical protein